MIITTLTASLAGYNQKMTDCIIDWLYYYCINCSDCPKRAFSFKKIFPLLWTWFDSFIAHSFITNLQLQEILRLAYEKAVYTFT